MKNKKSTQTLLGLQTFGKYGLKTDRAELVFYSVQPTNISVLSDENIDVKVHHLMSLLSMIPELELICLDSFNLSVNSYYSPAEFHFIKISKIRVYSKLLNNT